MSKRVQFDLSDEDLERSLPFIDDPKYIGLFGKRAYLEWLNRMVSRRERAEKQKKAESR